MTLPSSVVVGEWVRQVLCVLYHTTVFFFRTGKQTLLLFVLKSQSQLAVSAGTVYGYVVSSSFGGGITTVGILAELQQC